MGDNSGYRRNRDDNKPENSLRSSPVSCSQWARKAWRLRIYFPTKALYMRLLGQRYEHLFTRIKGGGWSFSRVASLIFCNCFGRVSSCYHFRVGKLSNLAT